MEGGTPPSEPFIASTRFGPLPSDSVIDPINRTIRTLLTHAGSYQSLPSGRPSAPWMADHQVKTLTLPLTLRTLPSTMHTLELLGCAVLGSIPPEFSSHLHDVRLTPTWGGGG